MGAPRGEMPHLARRRRVVVAPPLLRCRRRGAALRDRPQRPGSFVEAQGLARDLRRRRRRGRREGQTLGARWGEQLRSHSAHAFSQVGLAPCLRCRASKASLVVATTLPNSALWVAENHRAAARTRAVNGASVVEPRGPKERRRCWRLLRVLRQGLLPLRGRMPLLSCYLMDGRCGASRRAVAPVRGETSGSRCGASRAEPAQVCAGPAKFGSAGCGGRPWPARRLTHRIFAGDFGRSRLGFRDRSRPDRELRALSAQSRLRKSGGLNIGPAMDSLRD